MAPPTGTATAADSEARTQAPAPTRTLLTTGALAGLVAAAATTAIAAAADAAGVSLEVDAEAIPLSAFPFWTLVGAALGTVLARATRTDRRRFLRFTVLATALSLLPAALAPDDAAGRAILVATHLAAAAIVIPALARRLSPGGAGRG
jgi:hypothetical protein